MITRLHRMKLADLTAAYNGCHCLETNTVSVDRKGFFLRSTPERTYGASVTDAGNVSKGVYRQYTCGVLVLTS